MLTAFWWQLGLVFVLSYLAGNFCAAVFVSKRFVRQDIRVVGSRNPGTTNMARVFGIKYGAVTLALDFLKAFVCVLASRWMMSEAGGPELGLLAGYVAGLAVILGHNYPALLRFKGGKGFASSIAVYLVLSPAATLWIVLAGIVLLLLVDRMSVFALAFFTAEAVVASVMHDLWWIPLFAWGYWLLAVIAHWPNIVRLARGEEKKLGVTKILNGTAPRESA